MWYLNKSITRFLIALYMPFFVDCKKDANYFSELKYLDNLKSLYSNVVAYQLNFSKH